MSARGTSPPAQVGVAAAACSTLGLAAPARSERYYASLSRDLGYEVWAFSAPGWGTLQEYLALDREVDRVKPQLIEWQTCANDFWNNDWELERGNYALNNLSVRPHLEDGKVVYRPSAPLVPLRRFLAERSSLASWLNGRFQRFLARWVAEHVPPGGADER